MFLVSALAFETLFFNSGLGLREFVKGFFFA